MSNNIDNILNEIKLQIDENDYEIFIKFSEEGKSRIMLQPVLEKLLADDHERIFEGLVINYNYGKDQYENNTEEFSQWYKNPNACGIASARDYLCYECAKKFLDEMTIGVSYTDDKEYTTLGVIDKYARKSQADEKDRIFESQKVAEFWKGYDQRQKEEHDQRQKEKGIITKNKKGKGFLRWFFGKE